MEKKYGRTFNSLFDCLPDAADILSGIYDENLEAGRILLSQIRTVYLRNRNIIEDPDQKFFKKLFDEIDSNLYGIGTNQENYVKDLLRNFVGISLYLNPDTYCEWNDCEDDACGSLDINLTGNFLTTLMLIMGLDVNAGKSVDDWADVEKYVLSCSELLNFFSACLDARCLHFKLDLFDIQEELRIFILKERDIEGLIASGYGNTVIQLIKKAEARQKALPVSIPSEAETIQFFTEYLAHDKPDDLAVLCKNTFNRKQSPKDYAIMLALLSLYGHIHLGDKQRKGFYESWYSFIEKPLPENRNYFSINKHLDLVNGFQFTNDTDPDYLNLKRKFDLALKELALVK